MRLGLGNNLVKTAFPIGTSPSLDLAFALDRSFATDPAAAGNALITSRRGPAAKFSRGSGATQVNAAGLIEYAPENLILPSGSATNSASTYFTRVVTGELDPDGDTTAEFTSLAAVSQARLQYTGILGFSYFSIWVKAKEGSPLPAFIHLVAGDGPKSRFDTSNWAILNELGAIGSVEYGANGWVKLRSLFPATTASALFKIVVTDGPTYGDGIAAGKVFILGGKQVSRNPSSQHYKTTSSAFYGPRFDHDPATFACKGLLIEESRTNLVERSEAFSDAYWSKAGVIATAPVVTADQVNSPSGIQSADRIVFPAVAGANAYSLVFKDFSQAAGVSTTQSIYLRGLVGGEKIWVMWTSNGITYVRKECVLTTSWQRFDLNYTSVSGLNYFQFGVDLRDASQSTQSAQTIFAWGAQVEAGAFPTSYLPTTSGTAIRSADVCSIIGDDFSSFYNVAEGTIFASINEFRRGTTYSAYIAFRNNINTSSERITIGAYGTKTSEASPIEGFIAAGGIAGYTARPTAIQQPFNVSLGYAPDNCRMALNGALSVADVAPTAIPSTVNELSLSAAGGMGHHIARIQYFRKRLPDAKLQTITTP